MLYVGLDVSQRFTAVCVVDSKGKVVAESKVLTLPSDIHVWLKSQLDEGMDKIAKVGLETGAMSNWLSEERAAQRRARCMPILSESTNLVSFRVFSTPEKLAQAIFQSHFGGRARNGFQPALEVLDRTICSVSGCFTLTEIGV
jgi:hypothetical protein